MADQYNAYGAMLPQQFEAPTYYIAPEAIKEKAGFQRWRTKMNVYAIAISLFVPWILFSLVLADVSFRVHYKHPFLCWVIAALGFFTALGFGGLAGLNVKQMVKRESGYQPTWYIFLFLTSLLAAILAPLLGNTNFWTNMKPYYDLQNLNDYSAVDPTRMRGQQMMDAGRVQFLSGATLDLKRAYAFQNLDTYCVAPITMNNKNMGAPVPLNSYDFWAVGINCCDGDMTQVVNFKCGPYNSKTAKEGLRLMTDDERPFFRLAVQQAESAHMVKAVHPLFFYWTEDAVGDMHKYLESAFKFYAIGMCSFFALQMCLVLGVTFILALTGHNNL